MDKNIVKEFLWGKNVGALKEDLTLEDFAKEVKIARDKKVKAEIKKAKMILK